MSQSNLFPVPRIRWRMFISTATSASFPLSPDFLFSISFLASLQASDSLCDIFDKVLNGSISLAYLSPAERRLYRSLSKRSFTNFSFWIHGDSAIYVPSSSQIRSTLLSWVHTAFQHPGVSRSLGILRSLVYWPDIGADTTNYVNSCLPCQTMKPSHHSYGILQGKLGADHHLQIIHVDLIGPFSQDCPDADFDLLDKFKYAMTMIDSYSK